MSSVGVQVSAPLCFLSFVAASCCFVNHILSFTLLSFVNKDKSKWLTTFPSLSPPAADKAATPKAWDNPQVLDTQYHLIDSGTHLPLLRVWLHTLTYILPRPYIGQLGCTPRTNCR